MTDLEAVDASGTMEALALAGVAKTHVEQAGAQARLAAAAPGAAGRARALAAARRHVDRARAVIGEAYVALEGTRIQGPAEEKLRTALAGLDVAAAACLVETEADVAALASVNVAEAGEA